MPTPHSATYPSAPSAFASAGPNTGSYPGLAEYMGLELTEAEVRANMPEYLPAVVQVDKPQYVTTTLSHLCHHRAAALPLCLGPAWLPPYLASLLASQKHRQETKS